MIPMNNTVITGIVEHSPEPDTTESYSRFEMPVRVTGRKEPVMVEMYGMRDLRKRFPKGKKVDIYAQKRTKPIFDGWKWNRVSYYSVKAIR